VLFNRQRGVQDGMAYEDQKMIGGVNLLHQYNARQMKKN
jgi:hypothetical protein